MAQAKALDRRRKSIRNIRKITRTMELIATARFKKAMDRATAATEYTKRITQLVADLATSGLTVSHPLLDEREHTGNSILLVLTANRGLCGGFNSGAVRKGQARLSELREASDSVRIEVAGKRGISALKFRGITVDEGFTHFDDNVRYDDVDVLANRYLEDFAAGTIDRLDVAYTQFHSTALQQPVVETLLPLGSLAGSGDDVPEQQGQDSAGGDSIYEFLPSAASILEEVVPASFKVKLFKCFLDSAVSEQVARMVAMKSATENADKMIKELSMRYNRARQGQITSELLEVIGGVEALEV